MKHAVHILIIGTCCGMLFCAKCADASPAGVFSLPLVTLSFDGLDARDASNRPLPADAVVLEDLFRSGAHAALVLGELHSRAAAQTMLRRFLRLADTWLLPVAHRVLADVMPVVLFLRRVMERILPAAPPPGGLTGPPGRVEPHSPLICRLFPSHLFPLMRC